MNDEKDFNSVDVVVLVSSSYEILGIYEDLTNDGYEYKQDFSGYLNTVGHISDRPICVTPLIHNIGGVNVLQVEATSELVDWKMIREWVKNLVPEGTDIFDEPTNLIINFRRYVKKVTEKKQ